MKFAVVEYDSKSHEIWRHTDERPNYLADPLTEIDPTSFGCYVSALSGEHIPLKSLAGAGSVWRRGTKRLTGRWPNYSLDYLAQFDVLLVVHQLADAHELVRAVQRLQQLPKHPFIIGVPTQPYGLLREATEQDPVAKKNLIAFIKACDVFTSIVEDTVSWYQELSGVPVTYLPQPYPVEFASKNFLPRQEKDKTIFVAGVTQRDNIKQGQLVAKELQRQFPDYTILVPKVHDLDYDASRLEGSRYQVVPFEQWRDHLQTLAKTTLVINTDYTKTRGRVQTDCAAVGTPSLGGNSDGEIDLFPELASTPTTPTEKIIEQGKRLLSDESHYASVVEQARQELAKYSYEPSAQRLRALLP